MNIRKKIQEIAKVYFSNRKLYIEMLKKMVKEIKEHELHTLPQYFFDESIQCPPEIQEECQPLGAWLDVRQNIIIDLLRFAGEPSIPILKKIAFGEYDWTQVKALRALCIMAAQGLHTEEIVDEIAAHLDQFYDEALIPTLEYLSWIKDSPKVLQILEKYIEEFMADDIDPAVTLSLIHLVIDYNKEAGRKYLHVLYRFALGDDFKDRHPILDGAVVTIDKEGNEHYTWLSEPPIDEQYPIEAALLYHSLEPNHPAIMDCLKRWASEHPDEQVREAIKKRIDE